MIETEIDITEAMESFSKAAKNHDLSSAMTVIETAITDFKYCFDEIKKAVNYER